MALVLIHGSGLAQGLLLQAEPAGWALMSRSRCTQASKYPSVTVEMQNKRAVVPGWA